MTNLITSEPAFSRIVVCADENGWEERRGTFSSQPRAYGVAAHSSFHRERFGAIFAHTVVPVMRTVGARNYVAGFTLRVGISHNPDTKSVRDFFPSAASTPSPCSVITAVSSLGGATAGALSALCTPLRLFVNSVGLFQAARRLTSLHRDSALFQSSERGLAPNLHSVSSLLSPANINGRRMRQSAVKG